MNVLMTIKNNWKKSLLLSCVVGYGVSTLKTNIEYVNDSKNNEFENTYNYIVSELSAI